MDTETRHLSWAEEEEWKGSEMEVRWECYVPAAQGGGV